MHKSPKTLARNLTLTPSDSVQTPLFPHLVLRIHKATKLPNTNCQYSTSPNTFRKLCLRKNQNLLSFLSSAIVGLSWDIFCENTSEILYKCEIIIYHSSLIFQFHVSNGKSYDIIIHERDKIRLVWL